MRQRNNYILLLNRRDNSIYQNRLRCKQWTCVFFAKIRLTNPLYANNYSPMYQLVLKMYEL